jgi:hypothetical protein
MHRKIVVVAVAALAAFVLASPAAASNWPSGDLDAAASAVAGHPVQVWCEENWGDWIHLGDDDGEDFSYLEGFTFPSEPIVFINPAHCETLHALLDGRQVGSYHSSIALLTLAHEAVHQRGVLDEGVTDCTALPLVPGLATDHFGVPRSVSKTRIVSYTKTVVRRVNGRSVRVRVRAQKAVRVNIANPYLADLAAAARAWHRAAPAEYQGTC